MALKLALWNANGLCQHAQEIEIFLNNHNIDIFLLSETRLTHNSKFKIKNYKLYTTNHPDGRGHAGSAILIKSTINHFEQPKYAFNFLQATTVEIVTQYGKTTVASVYCPPIHSNKKEIFMNFFSTLGNKFIVGGDFNAKHSHWGSRLTNTKGRSLLSALLEKNIQFVSTGEPTYWPTDPNKIPDLIDFLVYKGIDKKRLKIESSLDLSSDHSPVILTVYTTAQKCTKPVMLYNRKTNWDIFREELNKTISTKIKLKSEEDIDNAVSYLTNSIQQAAWSSTPKVNEYQTKNTSYSIAILNLVKLKRNIRKKWQQTRSTLHKLELNRITKKLKYEIANEKNANIQLYLSELTPTQSTDYDLWKVTKKLKQPQEINPPIRIGDNSWARSNQVKAETFASHLVNVFKHWDIDTNVTDSQEIENFLHVPYQLDLPMKNFKITEVKNIIQYSIQPKKSPGLDLITGSVLQQLPKKCLRVLTYIYNAMLKLKYFPFQWKLSQIIMILKPNKPAENVDSYRPISLLPVLSKVFEKLLMSRLMPIIEERGIIPNHQFGFRHFHSTIEQTHRIVNIINQCYEEKKYCSAVFLDISQAFDKVWHTGLLYKLKKLLPYQFYEILKSYLSQRHFIVKQKDHFSNIYEIAAGVPQGSVLGPLLYLIFTSDLPKGPNTSIATFADDTAILASHENSTCASNMIQFNLNLIQNWMVKWKIKANENKSNHITFTLRKDTCPPVKLNNKSIPQSNDVRYLGIHLDRRLTWQKHIFTKRKQLGLKLRNMYWLLGKKSELSLENKLLLYKTILKPIWTYGIQLWGSASKSNIETIQRFQNKILRLITDAPWYVTNECIKNDLQVPSVLEEVRNFSQNYRGRLDVHPNPFTDSLMNDHLPRRLKRNIPANL